MNTEHFKKHGFVVLKNKLQSQTIKLLKDQFKMMEQSTYQLNGIDLTNKHRFSDQLVNSSFSFYNAHCFEVLMMLLKEDVEKIVDKQLYPTYSYARIMYPGASMPKHTDRESCEYSVSICVSEDIENPYPLWIEDYSGQAYDVHLSAGNMVVYKGRELQHWRDDYKGKEHIQAFMHYVDVDGPYADWKFDKRAQLGLPGADPRYQVIT
jgi:hypothetical protein